MQISPARWMLMTLVFVAMSPASAGPTEVDGTRIDSRVYRSYEANWRKYAQYTAKVDDGYAIFPEYDRRFASSRGVTTSQAMEQLKAEKTERVGNLVRKRVKYPHREDGEALANALPELRVGMYGWLAGAEVVKVIDRKQMIVRELWLVDRDTLRDKYKAEEKQMARANNGEINHELLKFNYGARIKLMEQQEDRDEGFENHFRLIGYDTRGLRPGDRWKGPNNEGFQVGVARWEVPEDDEEEDNSSSRRRRGGSDDPRLVLTEIETTMRRTLDEEGFKKLLAERGMTVVAFVDLVRSMREDDQKNAEKRIINELLPDTIVSQD